LIIVSEHILTPVRAQATAPIVKRLFPKTISAGSPTFTVRLKGKHFDDGAVILFDGVPLSSSRVSSKGKLLLAEVDASMIAIPGTHTVQASNSDASTTSPLTLTVAEQDPDLTMLLGGNSAQEDLNVDFGVEIRGTGFNENSQVLVWGSKALETTFVSDTILRTKIQGNLANDPARIPIMVRNKNGHLSNADIFFVIASPAILDSVDPDTAKVGDPDLEISISGSNFRPNATVVVQPPGGDVTQLDIVKQKDGKIVATIPAAFFAQPGELIVRVEQDGIQSKDATIAVSPTDEPFIFSIAPATFRQQENKDALDVIGANFFGDSTVLIDGVEAKIKSQSRRRLKVLISPDLLAALGTHDVQVMDNREGGVPSNITSFKVVPDVQVSTLTGTRHEGFNDTVVCAPADDVKFRRPRRISLGGDGLLYLTDQQNHAIRSVDPATGEVCTIAGTGVEGYNDTGNSAGFAPSFSFPNGIAVDSDGSLLVTENGNNVVRRIIQSDPTPTVETFAGTSSPITDKDRQKRLNATQLGRNGFRDGSAFTAAFRLPDEVLVGLDGTIYVVDADNAAVRRIRNVLGVRTVETVAGTGVPGFADGISTSARFQSPTGLALSPDGLSLYVADTGNDRIRRINLVTGRTSTVAGSGSSGGDDGPGEQASFNRPIGVAVGADETIYVSELGGNRIRRIDPQGNVSTLTGDGGKKFKDGAGIDATFKSPTGMTIDRVNGLLYVVDADNIVVRKIVL
jgi:sugar lactone lactonase YvrE